MYFAAKYKFARQVQTVTIVTWPSCLRTGQTKLRCIKNQTSAISDVTKTIIPTTSLITTGSHKVNITLPVLAVHWAK